MSEPTEQSLIGNQYYARLSKLAVAELLEEYESYLETAAEDMDMELIKCYAGVLQEKAPVAEQFNLSKAKAAYLKGTNRARKSLKSITPGKSRLRVISTLAAACFIFVIFFGVSEAYGFNIFQRLMQWTEEVLFVGGSGPGGAMELTPSETDHYVSLADALSQNGLSTMSLPTWIPEDYVVEEIDVQIDEHMAYFFASYSNGNDLERIILSVEHNPNIASNVSIEIDSGLTADSTVYQSGGQEYYFLTNMGVPTVVWYDESSVYILSGNHTDRTLKAIIDSIHEGR